MFRRLEAATGVVRWETNVRGTAPKYFFHGDVLVTPDRVVASTDVDGATGTEAGLHAFDRESGRQLWMGRFGRGVLGAVIGNDSHAYAYTATGDLIAIELATGRTVWTHPLKAPPWESPAILNGRVFGGSTEGTLIAFDRTSGKVEWQRSLGAPVTTSIRATTSGLFVGTSDGAVHRLAANTGERLSVLKLDDTLRPSAAPLLLPDSMIVLLADEGANYRTIVSVDLGLERVSWRRGAADRWSTSRAHVAGKTVLVGTPTGEVDAFCSADGAPAWSHKLASVPIRVIGGSGQLLFAGTPQGTLFAIRPPRSC